MTLVQLFLSSHILAGTLSLIVAPIALAVRKGGKAHRVWGKIFVWGMTWVFISAVILSLVKWIPFLLMIAFFSYFNVAVGYRTLYQKQLHLGKNVFWYDWIIVGIGIAFNLTMIVYGLYRLIPDGDAIGYVSLFFGVGGGLLAARRLTMYLKPPSDKYAWFYSHIGHMIGGFIASCTAFSVVTMNFLPDFIQWVWPSLIGFPLLSFWIRSYKTKLEAGSRLTDLVELKV